MYIEMSENCNANHPSAIAIFNGTEDFIRPYEGYPGFLLSAEEALSFWRNYNQIDNAPSTDQFNSNNFTIERITHTGGSANVSVVLYKVIGGDHVWFDIDIEGQNLDRLIWNFLSRYDRNGLLTKIQASSLRLEALIYFANCERQILSRRIGAMNNSRLNTTLKSIFVFAILFSSFKGRQRYKFNSTKVKALKVKKESAVYMKSKC